MKRVVRSLFKKGCPQLLQDPIFAIWHKRLFRWAYSEFQQKIKRELFPDGKPIVVQTGPFQGMRYFDETVWGCITPKWLGSYEAELHPAIRQSIRSGYESIIDVGCAEGYYAVGMAYALPSAKVFAFDTDFLSRRQLMRLGRLNQVEDRLQVGSYCTYSDLGRLSGGGGALVICDIEGVELQLLDPRKAPSLYHDDILVEVHDAPSTPATIEETLIERFHSSHSIERLAYKSRGEWVEQDGHAVALPRDLLMEAADEHRAGGQQVWLWMRANDKGAAEA